jgi:4-hydroxybenzoyl-CoA thioesterase
LIIFNPEKYRLQLVDWHCRMQIAGYKYPQTVKERAIMFKAVQRIRVEWSHCDPARIIFNPNYYIWMDQGTHRLFEAAGIGYKEMVTGQFFKGFPLVASGAEYMSVVRYGDLLSLTSGVTKLGRTSLRVEHAFECEGELAAKGFEVRVFGNSPPENPDGLIASPLPDDIRQKLSRSDLIDTTLK